MQTQAKKILVLSDGPVPIPGISIVEGGGLRCWGLSRGLVANHADLEVTVAFNAEHAPKGKLVKEFEGVNIATWKMDELAGLLAGYDTVLVSYCMGGLSVAVAQLIRPDQQLVLDCYVPIYVEVSARNSKNIDEEYAAFHGDLGRWSAVLHRGDFFLCASEAQKDYYRGVLSAVGRINPVTYGQELILIVPYGIYREDAVATHQPISKLIGKDAGNFKKVLWFGGIYPWFDLRVLVSSVKAANASVPTKLIIVGARNPFNSHPDFVKKYEELVDYIKTEQLEDTVIMQDWVSFDDRANWYLDSDLVVVVNKLGEENGLAWRTRLVDFMWADLPIITNGGDPLGEELLAADAAMRFSGSSASDMSSDLVALLGDEGRLRSLKANIVKLRANYFWDVATSRLAEKVSAGERASDLFTQGIYQISPGKNGFGSNKLIRIAKKAKKIPAYARKHGTRNTISLMNGIVRRKVARYLPAKNLGGRLLFISHQLDMSGAPFVLMDMVKQVSDSQPRLPIEFVTFTPVHHHNVATLNQLGIKPKIIMDRQVVPEIFDKDIVVLNTAAHSEGLKEDLFSRLETGRLQKLVWYIHEDEPELIFRHDEQVRMKKLMGAGKLKILIAAEKMRNNYIEYFGHAEAIVYQTYKLVTPKKYHRKLEAKDFHDTLSFVLPGTVGDGRKGQLPLLYAFADFYKRYYEPNPERYRNFELVFVGVITDFLSRQLVKHKDILGPGRFKTYGYLTKNDNLDVVMKSNITICYSMRECLPLFVFEGMVMGHPILRNDSSGIDEQLEEGKNGYELSSTDFWQMVATIERVLNRETTNDTALALMSKRSYAIAKSQEDHSYLPGLKDEIATIQATARG
jgi:glycosyltransferase involved in cell wall biosynthesis